ncbi:interaptin isoform X2 [Condylostylus longicornis]|uniref:interaptin isoform X2 n=1 Tax=Condylostylus longicornis TaxID=2530218 RepID=UPI00244DE915|nr:interaptin isoform X2 [Condylostylus longicornis]
MDYHVIIVIACVFLASLFSILFINKFFKNKTYEEAAAEKKALVEKLYPTKVNSKKIRKFGVKKEFKKDKKRPSVKDSTAENDLQDSEDIEEEESPSVESSPGHIIKSKPHVDFSQNQENLNDQTTNDPKGNKSQNKKKTIKTGILVNKNETSPVQENNPIENINHFEKQHPKDVIELKKQHKDEQNMMQANDGKNSKNSKDTGKKANKKKESIETITEPQIILAKEVKITEVKAATPAVMLTNSAAKTESPKSQGNKKASNTTKSKNNMKELSIIDKIGQNDVIGVNYLIQLFAKAELNRNDIQILIDFLLNKQQDTAAVAHEWSDDMVTKLRKQLTEKEKALQEEIEASAGIQAKLKDLRAEINSERAQFNANIKAYTEELQAKKNEIVLLTSDIQSLNDKLQVERQQFQAKLRHEKQVGSQELVAQIQQIKEHNTILQNEVVQKNSYINDLQRITNASHQTIEEHKQKLTELNEIYQQKVSQIHSLETGLAEANETIQRLQYDLEMAKISENEKEGSKVEIRNLQNALETTKSELNSANMQLSESQQKNITLNNELEEIKNQFSLLNLKYQEHSSESTIMKNSVDNCKKVIAEKDSKLNEFESQIKQLLKKEDDLIRQLTEQRDKNNISSMQTATGTSSGHVDQQTTRDIFQRLFPDAVKKHSSTALSTSFNEWVEQVVLTHIELVTDNIQKQQQNQHKSSSENLNSNNNNNHHSPHNHNSVSSNNNNSSEVINSKNLSSNNSNRNIVSIDNNSGELLSQNIKLKAQIEELTNIVTKTESMLKHLENQARDQDAHWRKIVESQEEEINLLKNANGEAI